MKRIIRLEYEIDAESKTCGECKWTAGIGMCVLFRKRCYVSDASKDYRRLRECIKAEGRP